ncbi:MAG TPA: DUF2017 domain-containing protein [Actinomycetales bacterium]|nr:DUF2017 domain-containing protein [Actinomycetales bacterium]
MARRFRRSHKGITVSLDEVEVDLLARLFADVAGMLAPVDSEDADPLAAMVGITEDARMPDDPALARLLPDANRDDPDAAAEFRRFTERGLRDRKTEGLATAAATLDRGQPLTLSDDEARAWLTALTDVRLVVAERLGLRTDDDTEALHLELADLPDGDPRAWLGAVYDFLTWLQESLAEVLLAGLPDSDATGA